MSLHTMMGMFSYGVRRAIKFCLDSIWWQAFCYALYKPIVPIFWKLNFDCTDNISLLCRYTSQVYMTEPSKVLSKVSDSTLFDHLDTTWEFKAGPTPSTTWLNFDLAFAFKSPLYSQIASVFFDEARLSLLCLCIHIWKICLLEQLFQFEELVQVGCISTAFGFDYNAAPK